jgi:pimeloyl-ACP methyl ester carboxylesterase
MGASQSLRNGVQQLVRSPFIGQTLYKLNTLPSFLHWMYRRHVYVDAAKLTPDFIDRRYRITQQSGARFAPAAFVTGNLDPVGTRAEFLAEVQSVAVPLLAIVAEQAPPASKAEMEAIAALSQVQVERLPGSLGLAEEFGAEVAAAILPWL